MTQYNSLNVELSNSQLKKLKSAIKNETEVSFDIIIKYDWYCDNETNFPHELLLSNRKVANLCKAFVNNSSTDIKLSKTDFSKVIQSGGFLRRLLGPLQKTGLPLLKNVIMPLAKNSIRTNSSSTCSRCRNTYKSLKLWRDSTNNIK